MPKRIEIRNPDRPIVFVHIVKAAGTSFSNYLHANMSSPDDVAPPFMGDISAIGLADCRYKLYFGHFDYASLLEANRQFHYLTFVRHPLQRSISQWKSWHKRSNLTQAWLDNMQSHQVKAVRFAQEATLDEFFLSDDEYVIANISNVQTRFLSTDSHEDINSAKDNLENKFTFFGIVERFSDSIRLFRNHFSGTTEYRVPPEGENRSNIATPTLSRSAAERILELNSLDFQLYEFASRVFEARLREFVVQLQRDNPVLAESNRIQNTINVAINSLTTSNASVITQVPVNDSSSGHSAVIMNSDARKNRRPYGDEDPSADRHLPQRMVPGPVKA